MQRDFTQQQHIRKVSSDDAAYEMIQEIERKAMEEIEILRKDKIELMRKLN